MFTDLAKANARIEELEEQVKQLRQQMKPVVQFPRSWGLTKRETVVLQCLLARDICSREYIMTALYDINYYERDIRVVDQYIKRIRGRFDKHLPEPVSIQTHYGIGYSINPKGQAYIKQLAREAQAGMQINLMGDNKMPS